MVDTIVASQTATEAEVAAAAAEAVEAFKRDRVASGDEVSAARTIPGTIKPMQYRIPPQDEGTWVMVWELKLDANGEVYGDPTRAPRQQLGLWLQKRRDDGGPRFSTEMPNRLRAEPTIPCLSNGAPQCTKKFYTRQDMVMHVRSTHPTFAAVNKVLLDQIMEKVAQDNPRLAALAEAIANMEDPGLVSVEVNPVPRQDKVDEKLGAPQVSSLGIQRTLDVDVDGDGCAACDWTYKEEWNDRQKKQFLHTHTLAKHKDEI